MRGIKGILKELFGGRVEGGKDELIGELEEYYRLSKASRERVSVGSGKHPLWKKFRDYYHGNVWGKYREHHEKGLKEPVINRTWSIVETIVPHLMQTRPRPSVIARGRGDEAVAEQLRLLFDFTEYINNFPMEMIKVFKQGVLVGTSFLKVGWDEDLDHGEGWLSLRHVNVDDIYVDPNATDVSDARWLIHERYLSMDEIREAMPWVSEAELVDIAGTGGVTRVMSTDGKTLSDYESESETHKGLRVLEYYLRVREKVPAEVTQVEVVDKDGLAVLDEFGNPQIEEKVIKEELKYKGGIIIRVLNGKILPSEDGNLFEENVFDDFPFVRWVANQDEARFWGVSDVMNIIPIQDIVDSSMDIYINSALTGMSSMVSDSSMLDHKQITNAPNQLILLEKGASLHRLPPAQVPDGVNASTQIARQEIEDVSGVNDALMGRRLEGIEAAAAIEMVKESALTRISLKETYTASFMERIGRLLLNGFNTFLVGDERLLKITTHDGTQQMVDVGQIDFSSLDYDVRCVPGSGMHMGKARLRAWAFDLYNAKAIDRTALLELSGIPDYEAILNRMDRTDMLQSIAKASPEVFQQVVAYGQQLMEAQNGQQNPNPQY